jgi:cyclopropane fatty-acyl-phospholipid synthase-like methyltransferase
MGLSESLTLLLLGAGLGGPAAAIATKYGGYVESFEAEAELAAIAEQRRRTEPTLRRVTVAAWDRDMPTFKPRSANHALSLEASRGAPLPPILASLAAALRPHGHVVLTEMVCDGALPEHDREFAAWCRLENRRPALPHADSVGSALKAQGFDVRVVEDLSEKHVAATLSGWRAAVKTMAEGARPDPATAGIFVTEAELWLLRVRLMRRFGFRLLRWHAIGSA